MALVLMATHGWGTLFIDPDDLEAGVGLQSSFTNPADATAATHYADDTGASPSTGAVTADANGRLMRYVEEGTYTQELPGGATLEVQAVSGATVAAVAISSAGERQVPRFDTTTGRLIWKDPLEFDVADYGAVADGTTHPLSEVYGSLGAAQAVFPFVTALTQQRDWAAVQAAITDAMPVRGTVRGNCGSGGYYITDTIEISSGTAYSLVNLDFTGHTDTGFKWEGASDSAVFSAIGWKSSYATGIKIRVDAAASGVIGWDLDGGDPLPNSCGGINFSDCSVSSTAASALVGWRLGHAGNNTDFSGIVWTRCTVSVDAVTGASRGWLIEGANTLNNTWVMCVASQLAKGWTNLSDAGARYTAGGDSMFFYGCGGSFTTLDFQFATGGSYGIFGGRWEDGVQWLDVPVGPALVPVTISASGIRISGYTGFQYGGAPDKALVHIMGSTQLALDGCMFGPKPASTAWNSWMFYLEGGTGYGSLDARGCSFSAAEPPFIQSGKWKVRLRTCLRIDGSSAAVGYFSEFPQTEVAANQPNGTLFLDAADGKLKYKDAAGTTNALY